MQVAIIGGGVGGLAVAYNLVKTWPAEGGPPPSVTVYEAGDRFGGNADTAHFSLGIGTPPAPGVDGVPTPAEPYIRWADLGVNDFNKVAYVKIVEVMREIGFTGYKPLEDSTSYYTLDGSVLYASGNSPTATNPMPPKLSAAVDAFMKQAGHDADHNLYSKFTIRQYIEEVFSKNSAYDARLGPQVIYPRVNGMYFTHEVDPTSLPFAAIMHYYKIQEGAGGEKAERMYFVEGCSSWIAALTDYMKSKLGITLVDNFKAQLHHVDGAWHLYDAPTGGQPSGAPIVPDVVVVATHADDALKLIVGGTSTQVTSCLGRVNYLNGLSVAHTYAGMLPTDYNGWCTYNILIHQAATYLKPYTITYVCNRHQNDGADPTYDKFGYPQFFITVNPPVPIPQQYVLMDTKTKAPAIADLRHNIFDFDCLSAQKEINTLQGQNRLYFAGGWTVGAGLHEECWHQGEYVAGLIAGKPKSTDHLYDESRGPDEYAPNYMRRLTRR